MELDEERDPVDLSALDPARDRARWEGVIAGVAFRAASRRRASLSRAVTGYGVRAFALAAAAAIAIWVLAPPRGAPDRSDERADAPSPSDGLAGWALQGSPDGAALLGSLGG